VLLVTALKPGSMYVVPVDAGNRRAARPISREIHAEKRAGGLTKELQDRGAILGVQVRGRWRRDDQRGARRDGIDAWHTR